MAETEMTYFSVGDLRKVVEGLDDNVPVLSAPINDKVRVAMDINIVEKGKFGNYEGKIVLFNTELIDIATNSRIVLGPASEAEETKQN